MLKLASVGAIKLDNAEQFALTLVQVNEAAEELYKENDLVGALWEQVFEVNPVVGNQITLPNYVGQIRAVRYYCPDLRIGQVDMRPKYAARTWQSSQGLDWRNKDEVATFREITNASLLTITFKEPLTNAVQVTVVGETENAAQLNETIRFAIGDQTKTTVNSFNTIKSISKNATTSSNCDVYDIDDLLLASIPNNQATSTYRLAQIIQSPNNAVTGGQWQPLGNYVELLFKWRLKPFVATTDEFICPDYDTAIFWKWKQHRCLYKEVPDLQGAMACLAQANKIVKDIANDHDQNLKKSINFGPNPTYQALNNMQSWWNNASNPNFTGYPYATPLG